MKKKAIDAFKILFFLGLGIGLAWYSMKDMPMEKLTDDLKSSNALWLGLALVISFLSHIIRALRWNMLLQPTGHRVKPVNAIMSVFAAYLVNLAIPRSGEIFRCGLVSRYDKVPATVGVGTVVAERVVDMIFLLLFFLLSFFIGFGKLQAYIQEKIISPFQEKITPLMLVAAAFAGVAMLMAGIWYMRRRKKNAEGKKNFIDGFIDGLKSVMEVRNPLAFVLASISIWACYFLMLYIGFLAFPATAGLGLDACLAVFVMGTVGMIVTPGGIGAYPALVGQTLLIYGIDVTSGNSFGMIIWGSQTLMIIVLGLLSLVGFPLFNRSNKFENNEGTVTA